MNYESIPKEMYYGGISVDINEQHEVFADYFSSKIIDLVANAVVDQAVYKVKITNLCNSNTTLIFTKVCLLMLSSSL